MARLAFLGTPELAVVTLRGLVEAGHEVAIVVSRPDVRRGRGGASMPSPVKAAAVELGLEVTDDLSAVGDVDVDLAIVVAYGRIIPTSLLERVPMVNLHFSLLPRWRGAAPVERAILAGDEVTGVCAMAVAPELDTGDVFARAETTVGDKTLVELQLELAELGTTLLVDLLSVGLPAPVPQEGEITYAAKISRSELSIDWTSSAEQLLRMVRLGGATASFDGRRLIIRSARDAAPVARVPGTLVDRVVATGSGGLELVEVQPESRKAMAAADWLRGLDARQPIVLGNGPAT